MSRGALRLNSVAPKTQLVVNEKALIQVEVDLTNFKSEIDCIDVDLLQKVKLTASGNVY